MSEPELQRHPAKVGHFCYPEYFVNAPGSWSLTAFPIRKENYVSEGIVPKVLHSLHDLKALDWGSVVLDRNQHVWQTDSNHTWHGAQDDFTYTDAEFIAIVTGPYTLVWVPE